MLDDVESCAAALYDGGWTADDRDEMKAEYHLSDSEADVICDYLKSYK